MNNRDKVLWGTGVAVLAAGAGAAAIAASQKIGTDPKLRQVAAFDHQVTGISMSAEGRIFVNFPRWTEDAPVSVGELLADGTLRPYPDARWNSWRNARANTMAVDRHFVCVQSIVCDGHGNLWVLDPGAPGNERILPGAPKLVKVDLATDRVMQTILFDADVALQGTYLNDIRFSPDGKIGYITDSGAVGAIIVVDLESGEAWRALDGHAATQPEKDVTVMIDGAPLVRPRRPAADVRGGRDRDLRRRRDALLAGADRADTVFDRHGQAGAGRERDGSRGGGDARGDQPRCGRLLDEQGGHAVFDLAHGQQRAALGGWCVGAGGARPAAALARHDVRRAGRDAVRHREPHPGYDVVQARRAAGGEDCAVRVQGVTRMTGRRPFALWSRRACRSGVSKGGSRHVFDFAQPLLTTNGSTRAAPGCRERSRWLWRWQEPHPRKGHHDAGSESDSRKV